MCVYVRVCPAGNARLGLMAMLGHTHLGELSDNLAFSCLIIHCINAVAVCCVCVFAHVHQHMDDKC